jgi:hypothetical protein
MIEFRTLYFEEMPLEIDGPKVYNKILIVNTSLFKLALFEKAATVTKKVDYF